MSNTVNTQVGSTPDPLASIQNPASSSTVGATNENDIEVVDDKGKEKNLVQKNRRKKSAVWEEFTMITVDNDTNRLQCNHCNTHMKIVAGGSTTHLIRHLNVCVKRQIGDKRQKLLTVESMGIEGMSGNLSTYKFDKEKVREMIAKMIIVHEYPFRMVEHELFIVLLKTLNPRFDKISRNTVRNDCLKIFGVEKNKLKTLFTGVDRISLTADLWTSNQTIGYMCLTGHFLDSEWKLQKRVLNFCGLPPPHTGVVIADGIFQCLLDWGIENKISTITLDNASANDVAVRYLKDNFTLKGKLYFKGKIFHVRCAAHILNLMVQDGLGEIRDVIENVRESVKYLKMSPSRLHKFAEIVKQLQLPTSKRMILDVPTRWNSTYAMLESALVFKDVFPRYKERDPTYQWLPSIQDWERAKEVCNFLDVFNEATNAFSGSCYPTSNLLLPQIWKIKEILNDNSLNENEYIREMTFKMREKFDKYWGDGNLLMAIAAVLDPRYKMKLIEFCFPKIYMVFEAERQINLVRESLYELYNDYALNHASGSCDPNNGKAVGGSSSNICVSKGNTKIKSKSQAEFDLWAQELDSVEPCKSDLDNYLEEGLYICKGDSDVQFDALDWWKANTLKFRVLSSMARDILSIPVSSVASESTFSAGGRVLDQYRSSLKPETVQALVCTGDWIRNDLKLYTSSDNDEESMQEVCLE